MAPPMAPPFKKHHVRHVAPLVRCMHALVGVAAIAMVTSGCTSHLIVRKGEVNDAALERVQKRTSAARGLPFKEEVGVEAYTQEESGAYIAKRYSGKDPERDRVDDVVAHRLGILPDGLSLSELFRRTLTQNAAGVYRPNEKKLYIVTDLLPGPMRIPLAAIGMLTGTDWNQELVLSHELVHALQDQHFDLANHVLPGRIWGANEDMALARKSIVESEANIVSQAYLLSVPLDQPASRNLLISYLALFNDLNVLVTKWMTPGLPPFYAKLFVEQYTQGMRFVQAATNRGGWGTLGEAYRGGLPRSTEQMMTPAKYFGVKGASAGTESPNGESLVGVDEPVPLVELSDALPPALANYVPLEENVFGALLWRIYLDDYMSRGDAVTTATGWGGDRYTILEERLPDDPLRHAAHQSASDDVGDVDDEKANKAGIGSAIKKVKADGVTPEQRQRRSVLIWRTQWDSEQDAREFFQAYRAVLVGKYPNRTVVTEQSETAFSVDVSPNAKPSSAKGHMGANGVRTYAFEKAGVYLDGLRAIVIEGGNPETFAALKAFAWSQNRVDQKALAERERGEGIYAAPPPPNVDGAVTAFKFQRPPEMPLAERIALPHHRAVFRMGLGARFNPRADVDGQQPFTLVSDRELRWGFRQYLEWTPPFLLSVDVTKVARGSDPIETGDDFVQTVVTAGLLDLSLGRAFGEDLVLLVAPAFAITQRVGIRGVSLVAQGRVVGDLVTHADVSQRITFDVAGALYVAPFAFAPRGLPLLGDDPGRLVLTLGAGTTFAINDVAATLDGQRGPLAPQSFVIGAATHRGFVPQPTLEFRLLDAVYLYEMSRVVLDGAPRNSTTFDVTTFDPRQLKVNFHEHTVGLLFRF